METGFCWGCAIGMGMLSVGWYERDSVTVGLGNIDNVKLLHLRSRNIK